MDEIILLFFGIFMLKTMNSLDEIISNKGIIINIFRCFEYFIIILIIYVCISIILREIYYFLKTKKKELKTINPPNLKISFISSFPSGDLIIGTLGGFIMIYGNDYNISQEIRAHTYHIKYISVKDNNNFVTLKEGSPYEIKIWIKTNDNFQLKKLFSIPFINKVIFFPNGDLILCSDNDIKIWKETINDEYELKIKLRNKNKSLLLLVKKQLLILAGEKGTQIYNYKKLKLIKDFKDIINKVDDGIANIDDDKIIIIYNEGELLEIISLSKMTIIKNIKNIYSFNKFRAITVIKEKNIFIAGGNNHKILIFSNTFYKYFPKLIKNMIELNSIESYWGVTSIINLKGKVAALSNGRVKIFSI